MNNGRQDRIESNPLIALPTWYRGVAFRSRLEARWAVFFDALHLRWEYEKEGYDLNGLWYLPDFWMPQLDCWIEIKAIEPTDIEQQKAGRLCHFSAKRVFIFVGQHTVPPDNPTSAEVYYPGEANHPGYDWDNEYWFCECPYCHAIGIEYTGRSDRLPCKKTGCSKIDGDRGHTYDSDRLVDAYTAARSERFGT
jgi:hypothetical protein